MCVCVCVCVCVCTHKDIQYRYIWCIYIQIYIHVPHFFFVLNFLEKVGCVSHGARHVTFGKLAAPGVLCVCVRAHVVVFFTWKENFILIAFKKIFRKKIRKIVFISSKKINKNKSFYTVLLRRELVELWVWREIAPANWAALGFAPFRVWYLSCCIYIAMYVCMYIYIYILYT